MKIVKNILLGGFLVIALFVVCGKTSFAATKPHNFGSDPSTLFNQTFTLKNKQITTNLYDPNGSPGQTLIPLTFTQSAGNSLEYDSTQQLFCQSPTNLTAAPAKIILSAKPTSSTVQGKLQAYVLENNGTACKTYTPTITIQNQDTSTGGTTGLPPTLTYNSNTYHLIGGSVYGLNTTKGTDCYGGSVIVANAAGNAGTAYVDLTFSSNPANASNTALSNQLAKDGNSSQQTLQLTDGCVFVGGATPTGYIGAISGTTLKAQAPPKNATGTGGSATPSDCEQNSGGWSFAWAVCPILDAANGITTVLVNTFEGQLAFSVGQLGDATNVDSGAFKVHKSWALIRDLSTAILVIILLVMVFSQATSFGMFDAYTVRKLLPKIVAAVILIQISWVGVSWIIDLFNAIARGLADLLFYPFGGAGNMDLWHLLQNANLSAGLLAAMNWGALLVVVALGVAYLFTILGVAFVAIIALFFAVLTLVFRKILIITLLILSPLAILAWILPGTERYWKMWRENLIKALSMFPIAVAIIAAGRIFAYVVGTQNNGQFLNMIFVMVGFFAPLFILPKTFKWGGQFMQAAGGRIMDASSKVSARPKQLMDKRQEGWSAERKRQSQERYTHDIGFNWRRPWERPIDLLRSGQADPTLWGRRQRQATTAYNVGGHESEEQDVKQANILAQMMIERTHPDEQDNYARALAAGQKVRVGRDGRIIAERYQAGQIMRNGRTAQGGELMVNADGTIAGAVDAQDVSHDYLQRRAGLDQAARLGGEGNIEFIQQQFEAAMSGGDTHHIEMMNQFTTHNVQSLFTKLPYIYKNNNYAIPGHRDFHDVERTVNGLNGNDVTTLSGVGMRTLRDNLIARNQQSSTEALLRLSTVFEQAATDPTLRARIPADVARAMRDLAEQYNNDPALQAQVSGHLTPAQLAEFTSRLTTIQTVVNDQGVVTG